MVTTPTILATLIFPIEGERVCLGYKRRGHGAGLYNGFGGKVQRGETVREGALRELWEECGLKAQVTDLEQMASNRFAYDVFTLEVTVFTLRCFTGEPVATEEMEPQWFTISDLPWEQMWASDTHWLPQVLAGRKMQGYAQFKNDSHKPEVISFAEVDGFAD